MGERDKGQTWEVAMATGVQPPPQSVRCTERAVHAHVAVRAPELGGGGPQ
jgi:hypothetical protein